MPSLFLILTEPPLFSAKSFALAIASACVAKEELIRFYRPNVFMKNQIIMIEIMVSIGTPNLNLFFWVLCLYLLMANIEPTPPPKKDKAKRVLSLILHFPFSAFFLSER